MHAYNFSIEYRPGSRHQNADCLSRLPQIQTMRADSSQHELIHLMKVLDGGPVTSAELRRLTSQDPILAKVRQHIGSGWPKDIQPSVKIYHEMQEELLTEAGCVLQGCKVVIPPKARCRLLDEAHEGHPGVVRMKALARSYFWWPGMDLEIERYVTSCKGCEQSRSDPHSKPAAAPLGMAGQSLGTYPYRLRQAG